MSRKTVGAFNGLLRQFCQQCKSDDLEESSALLRKYLLLLRAYRMPGVAKRLKDVLKPAQKKSLRTVKSAKQAIKRLNLIVDEALETDFFGLD